MRAALRASLLAAIAGAGLLATPAQAQFYWGWGGRLFARPPLLDRPQQYMPDGPLSPGEINALLREEGYRPIGRPSRSGEVYIAQAETREGWRVRIVVHAYDGDIIERRIVNRATTPLEQREPRATARRPGQRDRDEAALPPRPVQPAPLPPLDGQAGAPAPLPEPTVRPAPPIEAAVPPPRPAEPPPPATPRENQAVTPKPMPGGAPMLETTEPERPKAPSQAAVPPRPTPRPSNAAPRPATPPASQEARPGPRVILPNPVEQRSSSDVAPVQPLEMQPATPTPSVPAAPLE